MAFNPRVVRAYVDHFLPRDVFGPVLIVFSLEGVIDGLFTLYVPNASATIGWGIVFVIAIVTVAYWGAVDESAREELEDRIEEIREGDDELDGRDR